MARNQQHLPSESKRPQGKPINIAGAPWCAVPLAMKGTQTMTKTLDVISEAIRNPKHPFRKTDNRPKKAQKNRYERRKIREYLHLGDWAGEEAAA